MSEEKVRLIQIDTLSIKNKTLMNDTMCFWLYNAIKNAQRYFTAMYGNTIIGSVNEICTRTLVIEDNEDNCKLVIDALNKLIDNNLIVAKKIESYDYVNDSPRYSFRAFDLVDTNEFLMEEDIKR